MMDTVLNLGITDEVEEALAELSGDRAFARSTHCRFIHQFGQTVLGADIDEPGEDATPEQVREAVRRDTGEEVPTDPHEQLRAVIATVFGSWSSRRAKTYRRHWGIPEDGGTAVIVQAMVFGNLGEDSGTGVLFSRNPLTGDPAPYGEWLPGGQGEDVVSGTHDPLPLAALASADARAPTSACSRPRSCSSASTATSRTSSSRSSAASSSCCRRARPSARRWPPCAPPSTSPTRARSTAPRRVCRVSAEQLATRAGAAPLGRGERRRRGARARRRRLPGRRRRASRSPTPTPPQRLRATPSWPARRPAPRTSAG